MRLLLGLLLAVLVNWGLFSLMQSMVKSDDIDLIRVEEINVLDFVRLKEQTNTELKKRELPDKPPPPKKPPPPESEITQAKPEMHNLKLNVPRIEVPLNITGGPYIGDFLTTPGPALSQPQRYGSVMPLVRIPPRYPRSAARRNIEGKVRIAFTITTEGRVRDPKVLESIPEGVFDKAAINAIMKWKFNPKIVAGEAVEQTAAQEIEFKLPK